MSRMFNQPFTTGISVETYSAYFLIGYNTRYICLLIFRNKIFCVCEFCRQLFFKHIQEETVEFISDRDFSSC